MNELEPSLTLGSIKEYLTTSFCTAFSDEHEDAVRQGTTVNLWFRLFPDYTVYKTFYLVKSAACY